MSRSTGNCNKISHIVRILQMLRRWRKKAATSSDVPAGHVAIRVGSSFRRFVVRATYLNHPIFKKLLVQAEEEYGFVNQGPLTIPCNEFVFEQILEFVSRGGELGDSGHCICYEDFQRFNLVQSRPLLGGFAG
ncbi:auxin-induced protein X15-like [Coffea arabica]|uniref:Auxin-induced protein X15-like n=1 Tax=Coffea arabica TaxID=13443 RepID=A0A6P6W9I6_COFAR|nr:auxin-induced protein X15-like [Coffea arabica]